MFVLTFIVIFGPKKSTLLAYMTFWHFNYYNALKLIINSLTDRNLYTRLNAYLLFRFQLTVLTCRTTIYVLLVFWCFFFFFGEWLLLLTFNFSSLTDTIPNNFFLSFKTHTSFFLSNFTTQVSSIIMFYIIFFSLMAFSFLLNLRYTVNYFYFSNLWVYDLIFLIVSAYLFLNVYLFWVFVLFLLNFAVTNKDK